MLKTKHWTILQIFAVKYCGHCKTKCQDTCNQINLFHCVMLFTEAQFYLTLSDFQES